MERLIMVIDGDQGRGLKLKEVLEFMDAPTVQIASPETWRERLCGRHLAALFLGDDLPQQQIDALISDVGRIDPNTAIILLTADPDGEAARV